jgi:hypothetical protein
LIVDSWNVWWKIHIINFTIWTLCLHIACPSEFKLRYRYIIVKNLVSKGCHSDQWRISVNVRQNIFRNQIRGACLLRRCDIKGLLLHLGLVFAYKLLFILIMYHLLRCCFFYLIKFIFLVENLCFLRTLIKFFVLFFQSFQLFINFFFFCFEMIDYGFVIVFNGFLWNLKFHLIRNIIWY